jgi:hypothetical protein
VTEKLSVMAVVLFGGGVGLGDCCGCWAAALRWMRQRDKQASDFFICCGVSVTMMRWEEEGKEVVLFCYK